MAHMGLTGEIIMVFVFSQFFMQKDNNLLLNTANNNFISVQRERGLLDGLGCSTLFSVGDTNLNVLYSNRGCDLDLHLSNKVIDSI